MLRIQGPVCVGRGPIASSICPPFPYGMVAAKQLNAAAVITLPQRDSSVFQSLHHQLDEMVTL